MSPTGPPVRRDARIPRDPEAPGAFRRQPQPDPRPGADLLHARSEAQALAQVQAAKFGSQLADELATDEDGGVVTFTGRTRVTPGTPAPGQEAEAARQEQLARIQAEAESARQEQMARMMAEAESERAEQMARVQAEAEAMKAAAAEQAAKALAEEAAKLQ